MQWVRNESHHGLPRMVNAVGTEWVTPWVIKDGESVLALVEVWESETPKNWPLTSKT